MSVGTKCTCFSKVNTKPGTQEEPKTWNEIQNQNLAIAMGSVRAAKGCLLLKYKLDHL